MKTSSEINELFQKHGNVVRTSELHEAGVYYASIQKLIADGVIEKVAHGIYHLIDDDDTSEIALLNRLFPKAILCLETALFYYGYSDRTPAAWHLAVDKDTRKSKFNLDYPFVKPYYLEPETLDIGLSDGEIDGHEVRIYDKERTLCDCLKRSGRMDKEVFNKAVQAYVKDPQKNIPNLMLYAKRLRVEKKVKDLIGVWL